jgi:hypothetical protein
VALLVRLGKMKLNNIRRKKFTELVRLGLFDNPFVRQRQLGFRIKSISLPSRPVYGKSFSDLEVTTSSHLGRRWGGEGKRLYRVYFFRKKQVGW